MPLCKPGKYRQCLSAKEQIFFKSVSHSIPRGVVFAYLAQIGADWMTCLIQGYPRYDQSCRTCPSDPQSYWMHSQKCQCYPLWHSWVDRLSLARPINTQDSKFTDPTLKTISPSVRFWLTLWRIAAPCLWQTPDPRLQFRTNEERPGIVYMHEREKMTTIRLNKDEIRPLWGVKHYRPISSWHLRPYKHMWIEE